MMIGNLLAEVGESEYTPSNPLYIRSGGVGVVDQRVKQQPTVAKCNGNAFKGTATDLFEKWSKDRSVIKSTDKDWIGYAKFFKLMDGRSYALQVLRTGSGEEHIKLFNDRGEWRGDIYAEYRCKNGYGGSFFRSIDVMLIEQALEMATGKPVSVEQVK